jgi:hypothetical protein
VECACDRHQRPQVSDPPCGLGAYRTLRPTRELPASGGHSDGRSPAPPSGHLEGQPRAFAEERPPEDTHPGAE